MNDRWHQLSGTEVIGRLGTTTHGLSSRDARARFDRHGANELRFERMRSPWAVLASQLQSVVVWLLLAAAIIAAVIGDRVGAAVILAVLAINVGLGFLLELHAEHALDALRRLEARRAVVLRDGHPHDLDARELVPGDVVLLDSGQAVAADARLLISTELRINEASLTGESVPVHKRAEVTRAEETPLADRINMIYAGTTIATGSGRAVVVATGLDTELGRIGRLVRATTTEKTPLERKLDALGRTLVWISLGLGAAMVGAGVIRGEPLAGMLHAGIALAVAAVPEGLPAIATITLALGVRRMAKRRALIRRLPSVEALGSVTVMATDKTGTLTTGTMSVTTMWTGAGEFEVTGAGYAPDGRFLLQQSTVDPRTCPPLLQALTIGVLANRAHAVETAAGWTAVGDTTEAALVGAAAKAGLARAALLGDWPEVGEVPFSSERKFMATFHRRGSGELWGFMKGAPASVVARCDDFSVLDPDGGIDSSRAAVLAKNREMAARGLRVIALADGPVREIGERGLTGLRFAGLVGMSDPPAPQVEDTVRRFREAGIRTVMITGDQRLTAEGVARAVGILMPGGQSLEARQIAALSDAELAATLETAAVFSRVSPEIKLRLVTAFQRRGDVVAMLGDGVNDAAALKKADVGVAMGLRGTDVARETAAVVLQDDRFETIGVAIEEGRVIFDNIRKFTFYLFSCNLAEVFVLLGAALLGLPLALLPIQILWLNLVTDTAPALALAFEPGEPDIMRRPPRDPKALLLSRRFLAAVLFYALLIAGATSAAMLVPAVDDRVRMTVTFATLGFGQLLHLGNARSTGPVLHPRLARANALALAAVALVSVLQVLAIHYAPLATLLGTTPLGVREWLVVGAFSALPALIGQILKACTRPLPK